MMSTEPVSQEKHDQTSAEDTKHTSKKEIFSQAVHALKQSLLEQDNPEEKLKMAIEFMKQSLAQEGTPRFKDFWDAKNLCLPLFKEKLSQSIKEVYWARYTELASEAKRLKEILEEQSSFAIEQIELALKALALDVQNAQNASFDITLPGHLPLSKDSIDLYQSNIGLITAYVHLTTKLKALREEVLATEMRVRHKNRFLKEMSDLGDVFIPKKKELIKAVSARFIQDVEAFVSKHFDLVTKTPKSEDINLKQLRDHIQSLQEVAKKLSLNAHAFSKSREYLSQAWELMRLVDKEKKKEFSEKKAKQQEMAVHASALIEEVLTLLHATPAQSEKEIQEKKEAVVAEIEKLELQYHEKKQMKAKLFAGCEALLKPFMDKKAAMEEQKLQELREKNARFEQYKDYLKALMINNDQASYHDLVEAFERFNEKRKEFSLTKTDGAHLEELRRDLYETILLKRENEIEQDQESLQKLYADWEKLKEQTRERLELYRKEESLSGFDFEKAMIFRELKDLEKARLDRAIEKMQQLEDQLD